MERKTGILSGYTDCGSYVPLGINHGVSDGTPYLSTIGQSCLCFIFFLCLFAHKNDQVLPPSVSVVTAAKKPVSYPGKGSL